MPQDTPSASSVAVLSEVPGTELRQLRATFESFRDFVERYSTWLSDSNIFVETQAELPTGAPVLLEIGLRDQPYLIRALGQVEWTRPKEDDDGPPGVALLVNYLDDASRHLIDSIFRLYTGQQGAPIDEEKVENWEDDVESLIDGAFFGGGDSPGESVPVKEEPELGAEPPELPALEEIEIDVEKPSWADAEVNPQRLTASQAVRLTGVLATATDAVDGAPATDEPPKTGEATRPVEAVADAPDEGAPAEASMPESALSVDTASEPAEGSASEALPVDSAPVDELEASLEPPPADEAPPTAETITANETLPPLALTHDVLPPVDIEAGKSADEDLPPTEAVPPAALKTDEDGLSPKSRPTTQIEPSTETAAEQVEPPAETAPAPAEPSTAVATPTEAESTNEALPPADLEADEDLPPTEAVPPATATPKASAPPAQTQLTAQVVPPPTDEPPSTPGLPLEDFPPLAPPPLSDVEPPVWAVEEGASTEVKPPDSDSPSTVRVEPTYVPPPAWANEEPPSEDTGFGFGLVEPEEDTPGEDLDASAARTVRIEAVTQPAASVTSPESSPAEAPLPDLPPRDVSLGEQKLSDTTLSGLADRLEDTGTWADAAPIPEPGELPQPAPAAVGESVAMSSSDKSYLNRSMLLFLLAIVVLGAGLFFLRDQLGLGSGSTPVATVAQTAEPRPPANTSSVPADGTASEPTDATTAGETVPGEASPGEATTGEASPGETTPGETTPGEATPDGTTPGGTSTEEAPPAEVTPDTTTAEEPPPVASPSEAPTSSQPVTTPPASPPSSATQPAPPASTPTAAPVTDPAAALAEVEEVVRGWAAAWSAQDPAGYIAAYAPSYSKPGLSRKDWENQRRARINAPASIAVRAKSLEVEILDASRAKAVFYQDYETDTKRLFTWKTMQLERLPEGWRIVDERTGK